MGRRSNFEKIDRDAYDTPLQPVSFLMPHLPPSIRFVEPCAGKGQLVKHLEQYGHKCVGAFDIAPRAENIDTGDVLKFIASDHYYDFDMFITNPPWSRDILHQIIMHLYWQKPTWILLDLDWFSTDQAAPFRPLIKKIVSVGRVKWFENTRDKSNYNAGWYFFDGACSTQIFGRNSFYEQK